MSLPDDYLSVDTPENVTFGYNVAGIGSRFLAALVDTLMIALLQILVSTIVLLLAYTLLGDENRIRTWAVAVLGLLAFAFFWGYYIFFEMIWNGQSPGKRWVGLRVIRADGTPITLSETIIRNLIRLIDFLPAYYGVGVVTMFVNEQSRRLGDLAAGTVVVRDRPPVTLESLVFEPPLSDQEQADLPSTLDLPLERLARRDIEAAEEYLKRRTEFSNRPELAIRLVAALFERMGLSPPEQLTGDEAESLLIEIVRAGRSRRT